MIDMDEIERMVSALLGIVLLVVGLGSISQYLTSSLTKPKTLQVVRDEEGNIVKVIERYDYA
ncbi:MAG: hypothetical protein QXU69_10330 [Thermofilaceae archaeon]